MRGASCRTQQEPSGGQHAWSAKLPSSCSIQNRHELAFRGAVLGRRAAPALRRPWAEQCVSPASSHCLRGSIEAEPGRVGPDHLAHRVPRYPKLPTVLLGRLPLDKYVRLIFAIVSTTDIPKAFPKSFEDASETDYRGGHHFWTPITPIQASFSNAGSHTGRGGLKLLKCPARGTPLRSNCFVSAHPISKRAQPTKNARSLSRGHCRLTLAFAQSPG